MAHEKKEPTTVYERLGHWKLYYKGFTIKVKCDFGPTGQSFHLIDGMPCAWGYIVADAGGSINVCPGAGWFQTVKDAKRALDILIDLGCQSVYPYDYAVGAGEFHRRYREGR
jgi:hypothetical protein